MRYEQEGKEEAFEWHSLLPRPPGENEMEGRLLRGTQEPYHMLYHISEGSMLSIVKPIYVFQNLSISILLFPIPVSAIAITDLCCVLLIVLIIVREAATPSFLYIHDALRSIEPERKREFRLARVPFL